MTPEIPARFWLSLLFALLLQLVALPDPIAVARPLWLPMVLAYWILVEPRAPSLIVAFVLGIVLDVLYNTVLGQHAACFLVMLYFVARLRSVLILLPLWQLTFALAPAWAGYCLLMSLVDELTRHRADLLFRWVPALSTIPFWPLVYRLLNRAAPPPNDE
ncbi:MAG: rod shape-determining protein MreD [Panacagrimonas sp.]